MFYAPNTTLLRAAFDSVCAGIPRYATETRALVAAKIMERASNGAYTLEELHAAGHRALVTPEARSARADD
jgi:hypothetical protein